MIPDPKPTGHVTERLRALRDTFDDVENAVLGAVYVYGVDLTKHVERPDDADPGDWIAEAAELVRAALDS